VNPTESPPQTSVAIKAKIRNAYGRSSNESAQDKRIIEYLPLVRHVVHKVAAHLSPGTDVENLISAGTLGLVKAARGFDPSHDAEFKTYAYIRIRGAVIDELRSNSFVPSAVHRQVRAVEKAYRACVAREGRAPHDEELAAQLGLPLEQLYRTLEEARRQQFLSIHGLAGAGDDHGLPGPVDHSPTPEVQAQRQELMEQLAAAIGELAPRDRQLLLLYYERDLTMKEIAEVLEITESRVSQLHASAVFKLTMKMRPNDEQP
jgi:RNA polymerase sigma factor for flagellar operon FliA